MKWGIVMLLLNDLFLASNVFVNKYSDVELQHLMLHHYHDEKIRTNPISHKVS